MGSATILEKYSVYVFNFVFVIGGTALIALGTVLYIGLNDLLKGLCDLDGFVKIMPINIIATGCIVFLIGLFGCFGIITENICMLKMYVVLLLIIFLLQVGLGTYAYINFERYQTQSIIDSISDGMLSSIKQITSTKASVETQKLSEAINNIQTKYQCCGASDKSDWENNIPKSCCSKKFCKTGFGPYYPHGCVSQIFETIDYFAIVLAIMIWTIGVVEIVAALVSFCLWTQIRNDARR